ncbi:biotin/lipoate A/B protein ligase family protein [Gemmatimonadota bacterium]
MNWTLIVEPTGRPGSENMSIDYSLLSRAQEGVAFLRLYCWSPACLSFGRNEPATRRYDVAEIERRGIDTVRRPTGGRAVWHDAELTYAVAAPNETFGALPETYNIIHVTIGAALRSLGIPTELAEKPTTGTGSLSGGACFAAPAGGEIVVAGKKLVGSAQVREQNAFLQHGSVLLEDGQDVVTQVTAGLPVRPFSTSISALLGRTVEFGEVADAVGREARKAWSGSWIEQELPCPATEHAKFADTEWTWQR